MEHGERYQNHRGNACKINDTDPVAVALALCCSALLVVDKCAQNEIKFKLKWDQIHSNLSCSKLLETKQNEDKSTEKKKKKKREVWRKHALIQASDHFGPFRKCCDSNNITI